VFDKATEPARQHQQPPKRCQRRPWRTSARGLPQTQSRQWRIFPTQLFLGRIGSRADWSARFRYFVRFFSFICGQPFCIGIDCRGCGAATAEPPRHLVLSQHPYPSPSQPTCMSHLLSSRSSPRSTLLESVWHRR